MQVENFDSSLILENRLSAVMGGKVAVGGLRAGVEPFVEQLAAPTATPGGGSAAAASGAMAAGLASMVASMSRGKKAYLQYERELSAAIARLSQLREELKAAIDADAESYNAVMKAYKQAKESANADGMIDAALKQATSVPLSVAERAREVAGIAEKLGPITNPNMKSDLTTALALARAAIEGALANVEINLESLKDAAFAAEVRKKAAALSQSAQRNRSSIRILRDGNSVGVHKSADRNPSDHGSGSYFRFRIFLVPLAYNKLTMQDCGCGSFCI